VTCLHCGATTTNGLALCDLCQRKARLCLEYLPVYYRNLARWRPGRAGSRPVPGSRVLYDGPQRTDRTGDRIADTLDETLTALTTWARTLTDDRPSPPRPLTLADAALWGDLSAETAAELADEPARTVALTCLGFEEHLTSVATLEWAGEFVRGLAEHDDRLCRLTETAVPGWYAGGCRRCGYATYVIPGLTWVKCAYCGVTTYARDHIDTILTEAREWVAPPARLAEALVALLDTEMSVLRLRNRIVKWGSRGRIEVIRPTDFAPRRHRLGEVLDALTASGPTRLTDPSDDASTERVG